MRKRVWLVRLFDRIERRTIGVYGRTGDLTIPSDQPARFWIIAEVMPNVKTMEAKLQKLKNKYADQIIDHASTTEKLTNGRNG